MVAHTFNHNTQEAEAGGVSGQARLQREAVKQNDTTFLHTQVKIFLKF